MNKAYFEELLLAHEDDTLTAAETVEFKKLLAAHPDARQRLVESNLLQITAAEPISPAKVASKPTRWQQWRPLTSAVAGLMLGCFSTSLVMAYSGGLSRVLLPLANPSFEVQEKLPQIHLAAFANQWSGHDTEIVTGGEARPPAKSGQRMIRLGPAPEGKGYFANLMIDLAASRPKTTRPLRIEVTAHFHASMPNQNEHYSFNAATFAGKASIVSELWENTWRDMRDASLTTTGKAIYPTAKESGWQRVMLRLDVPPEAMTLVISLGSNTPGPIAGRSDHFMDDVTASWLIMDPTQSLP